MSDSSALIEANRRIARTLDEAGNGFHVFGEFRGLRLAYEANDGLVDGEDRGQGFERTREDGEKLHGVYFFDGSLIDPT